MQEEAFSVENRLATISGYCFGSGTKTVVAFHGFGLDARNLKKLALAFHPTYRTIAIDLFFHGNSAWRLGNKPIRKSDWYSLFEGIIQYFNLDRFALAGFSLGGKVALVTYEKYFSKIDHLYLIAPDGIRTNFWYSLATYPPMFRMAFKSLIAHPNVFYNLTKILNSFGLVSKSLVRFANWQMAEASNRQKIYQTWVVYRKLWSDPVKIKNRIRLEETPTWLFVGKFDTIIQPDKLESFVTGLPTARFILLECGHQQMMDVTAAYLEGESSK